MTIPTPPSPPRRDLRPLVALMAGVALVLAVTLVLLLLNRGDDTAAATSTISAAPATTATVTTTATTAAVPLFEDRFDGASPLVAVSAPIDMALEVTADGRGKVTALTGVTCIGLYGDTYGDVEVSFTVSSDSMGTGTRFGALVFAEIAGDTGHYVAVTLNPAFRTLEFDSYAPGGFLASDEMSIPAEAAYDPVGTTEVTLRLEAGAITAAINGFPVTTWSGATAATTGQIGFILYPDAAGHTAIFDDLVVRAP